MKIRKITAVLSAVILALSFGGCLKYDGDILTSSSTPEDDTSVENNITETDMPTDNPPVVDDTTENVDGQGDETTAENRNEPGKTDSEPTSAKNHQTVTPSTEPSTSKTQKPNPVTPTKNGFDVIKSGTFYWKGRMQDEDGVFTPTEMASTKNSLYMSTSLNGADVALLIKGKDTYIIYPRIKGYMNMKMLMSLSGIDDEMFDTSAMNFDDLGNLSDATSTKQTTFNGKSCTDYVFQSSDGTTEIFMSGASFLGMRATDTNGKQISAMYVDYLTDKVPADKCAPPAGYTEYSGVKVMSFISELTKDMDE